MPTKQPPLNIPELYKLKDMLKKLPAKQLAELNIGDIFTSLTGRQWNFFWNPLPGPQSDAYDSLADELFYGGAAGGGKSYLLLGLAITKHQRSLILRRISVYLKGLVENLRLLIGSKNFKSSGHGGIARIGKKITIELNGCEHEKDKENYQGIPHDLICFDEISHFSRDQYQFITGWNRSEDANQRCRVVCAGNPPTTPEGRWVIEEWAPWLDETYPNPAMPGELRYYTTIAGKTTWLENGDPFKSETGELIKPRSRTFIKALLSDNPILSNTDYRSKLQSLPEPYRSMFLYGDMNAGQEEHEFQVIPTQWIRLAQQRWKEQGQPEGQSLSQIGVDVARGGKAKSVFTKRYGAWIAPQIKIPGSATPDGSSIATKVLAIRSDNAIVAIDVSGGFGGSPYDILSESIGKKEIVGVNNAESTEWMDKTGKLKFCNVRAASYWRFREALDPEGDEKLALPPDPELAADLAAPRYKLLASGIRVELKSDIVSRLGRSPDCGDSAVLSLWDGPKKKKFQAW